MASLQTTEQPRDQCCCGRCHLRLGNGFPAHVHPTAFLRFLTQALSAAKKQAREGSGYATIYPQLCWITCRGAVRSLSFDVAGQNVAIDLQCAANSVAVLELCNTYAGSRQEWIDSQRRLQHLPRETWPTISQQSIRDALMYLHDGRKHSGRKIVAKIRIIYI